MRKELQEILNYTNEDYKRLIQESELITEGTLNEQYIPYFELTDDEIKELDEACQIVSFDELMERSIKIMEQIESKNDSEL